MIKSFRSLGQFLQFDEVNEIKIATFSLAQNLIVPYIEFIYR